MSNIELEIILPNKTLPKEEAGRVIIPAVQGNFTVLQKRAPTTLLLTNGVLDIWNEDDEPEQQFFIQGGVADIADNKCKVITQKAINLKDINKDKAQELKYKRYKKLQEFNKALSEENVDETDSDSEFYEYIYQYFIAHPREDED